MDCASRRSRFDPSTAACWWSSMRRPSPQDPGVSGMQPQIRSAALQGYREVCASFGLDPIAMMQATGMDPTCLNDPDRRVPAESLFRLIERSAQVANAPDL